jgi:two-component system chemotaxis sensor kinase CheA
MANKNDDFLKRLLATFKVEADEHLKAMSAGLLELEGSPDGAARAAIVERVFREAHSLKGAARAVNLAEIESVCHALENVFAAMKNGQLALTRPLSDLMQEALDDLGTLLSAEGAAMAVAGKSAITTLIQRIDDAVKNVPRAPARPAAEPAEAGNAPPVTHVPPAMADASHRSDAVAATGLRPLVQGILSDTVRVSSAKLGVVMRQAEELLSPKLAAEQRVGELREIGATLAAWKKERGKIKPLLRSVERSLGKSGAGNGMPAGREELVKLLEYLDAERLLAKALEGRVTAMRKAAAHDQRALAGMVDGLLQDVREMLLLPFSSLLEAFPRFVRDIARDQGKDIALVIQGGEIEIDRRILEEMKDPLTHLLRNCVDHGIEKAEARREKHKPEAGTITLTVAQKDGAKVEIAVADDGAGIDIEKVKAVARRLGLVAAGGAGQLGEREALALVFKSGVSTSPIVTDISGRGLGLAIVREKAERLGGSVAIETRAGAGTTFRLRLPLSLATYRGVLVRAGDQFFVVPLRHVERALRADRKDIRTLEKRAAISLGGAAVALVHLADALALPRTASAAGGTAQALVLGMGGERIAFEVDEILGEQEVLVKMFGRQLARVRNVSGACVLGTGRVVPVLNVADLMKSAVQQAAAVPAPAAGQAGGMEQRSVMVVEDSITSRALLKNILESAGYRVTTAVDGIDAYTALKTGTYDVVVSDVDMPRMNGFDLTARIRADKQLAELPVVLVTALESREHRERGIDVGASAYIVKSSFDQSNLLDVVRRLI